MTISDCQATNDKTGMETGLEQNLNDENVINIILYYYHNSSFSFCGKSDINIG